MYVDFEQLFRSIAKLLQHVQNTKAKELRSFKILSPSVSGSVPEVTLCFKVHNSL